MHAPDFDRKVEETLLAIEDALEASGADIDYETVSDILTLTFADGSRIIVNKQGAAAQLWVAAKSGGFHYRYNAAGGSWENVQTGAEFFAELARLVSAQAGTEIRLG